MSRDTVRDGFARHPLEACAELFDRAPNLAAVVAAVAEDEPATWKGPQREGGKGDGIDPFVMSERADQLPGGNFPKISRLTPPAGGD